MSLNLKIKKIFDFKNLFLILNHLKKNNIQVMLVAKFYLNQG